MFTCNLPEGSCRPERQDMFTCNLPEGSCRPERQVLGISAVAFLRTAEIPAHTNQNYAN